MYYDEGKDDRFNLYLIFDYNNLKNIFILN
jgi:hypothetical protein